MIVGPLKNNLQLSIIILSTLCLTLWINTLVFVSGSSIAENAPEHILYNFLFTQHLSFVFKQIIMLLVVVVGGVLLNFFAIRQEIISKANFLPCFFYILFSFSSNTGQSFDPILIANLFVIPALYFLMESYREEQALSDFFKAGFFMGLASFFYVHYLFLFPLSFIALIILRAFNWREWVILLMGLLAPYYIYIGLNYITTNDYTQAFLLISGALSNFQKPIVSEYDMAFLIMIVLLFLFAFFQGLTKGFGIKVKTKKTKFILIWMMAICILMVFFKHKSDWLLMPCIIPLSIIIGDYLAELRQLKIANTLLTLCLGAFVIIYFHSLGIL